MDLRTRITSSLKDVRDRGQRLVQLNIELLTAELKDKGAKYAAAAGMFVAAGVLSLYALGFALATVAVALDLVLPLWLSLLIVTVALVLLIALLALIGRRMLLRAGTPAPEKAIDEARASITAAKEQLKRTGQEVRRPGGSAYGPPGQAPPHTPAWQVRPEPSDGTGQGVSGTTVSGPAGPALHEGRPL